MEERQEFLMKPKVDFCFKELMAQEAVRRGFLGAVLKVSPEEIRETILMPMHLHKAFWILSFFRRRDVGRDWRKAGQREKRKLLWNCFLAAERYLWLYGPGLWKKRTWKH